MNIKIEKTLQKPLLSREEGIAIVDEKTTPSNSSLKEDISKKLNKPADLVVIKRVNQRYGISQVEVNFYVYENQEALKRFEKESQKTRENAKAKAAAPAKAAGEA